MSFPQSLGQSGQPPDKAPTAEERDTGSRWDRSALFRLALLWLVGANLRMAVLALPPLLPEIQHQLGLSETAVGALTSLPVLLLALAAVLGSIAVAHLGPRLALVLGLLVVGVASGARGRGSPACSVRALPSALGSQSFSQRCPASPKPGSRPGCPLPRACTATALSPVRH